MKKYSDDYFEKKYKILFDKLTQKEGFNDDIKSTRKELGLPINGFANGQELAYFLIGKMNKKEQQTITFFAFIEAYAYENKIYITDENREEVTKAFLKKGYKKGISMIAMMVELLRTSMTKSIKSIRTKYRSLKLKCLNTEKQIMITKLLLPQCFL